MLPSVFDGNESPMTDFDESSVCNSGPSFNTGSVSAFGFGLDLFRGPMKQGEGEEQDMRIS